MNADALQSAFSYPRSSAFIRGWKSFGGCNLSQPIEVPIKRMSGNTDVPLPTRMTQHAAGYDLAAAVRDPVVLQPGDIRLIPCGFAMAVPHGYEAQVRPRSGLSS